MMETEENIDQIKKVAEAAIFLLTFFQHNTIKDLDDQEFLINYFLDVMNFFEDLVFDMEAGYPERSDFTQLNYMFDALTEVREVILLNCTDLDPQDLDSHLETLKGLNLVYDDVKSIEIIKLAKIASCYRAVAAIIGT